MKQLKREADHSPSSIMHSCTTTFPYAYIYEAVTNKNAGIIYYLRLFEIAARIE
jgi:hypothetical protein